MKLRNKKTGEIIDLYEGIIRDDGEHITIKPVAVLEKCYIYDSLAELNEEWEDYEGPKEHWCITMYGGITRIKDDEEPIDDLIEIGNYFNSKEDAYDAWEKLKAWTRLINHGLCLKLNKFQDLIEYKFKTGCISSDYDAEEALKDIDLLFGGEE